MKKFIKFFFNPIEDRELYLNDMASKGFQLEKSGSIVQKFSKSEKANIHYTVQYIGNMSNKERQEYMDFVESLNLRVFFAPFNVGKLAIGNIKYRPYNRGRSSLATTSGMINREIMIIESNGNEKIPVFTDDSSKYDDLLRRKAPYRYLALVSLLFIVLGLTRFQGNFLERTFISYRPLDNYPLVWTVVGFILLLISLVNLYRLNKMTKNI